MEVVDHSLFRVTRDADFDVSDEADDLLQAVEDELRRRRFGEVVRLEVDAGMSADAARAADRRAATSRSAQVYEVDGLLDLDDLWRRSSSVPGLRRAARPAVDAGHPAAAAGDEDDGSADVFAAIREGDILVHHPYDSFTTSVERFVEQAVDDPDVLAIKQTVYRTSDDSPLVPALIAAAERGKQAVCLVELKARFDERANIQLGEERWRRPGVHVVYGHPGAEDATPSASSSSAARATACATTSTSAPATTTRRPRASTPTSACSPPTPRSAPTSPRCSTT